MEVLSFWSGLYQNLIGHVASRAVARDNESCSKLPNARSNLREDTKSVINIPGFIVFQLYVVDVNHWRNHWICINEQNQRGMYTASWNHTHTHNVSAWSTHSQERRAGIKTIWRLIGCGLYNECFPIFIQEHSFCRDVTDKWCLYIIEQSVNKF